MGFRGSLLLCWELCLQPGSLGWGWNPGLHQCWASILSGLPFGCFVFNVFSVSPCSCTCVYALACIRELTPMKSELWAPAPQYVYEKENKPRECCDPVFTNQHLAVLEGASLGRQTAQVHSTWGSAGRQAGRLGGMSPPTLHPQEYQHSQSLDHGPPLISTGA